MTERWMILFNNKKKRGLRTSHIAVCGLMTALAMIFSYVESLIPIPVPVYGIKLGIANIAIIAVLYSIGWREAVIVNVLRIILTSFMFGNFNSFLFSIAGGVLSIAVMIILKHTNVFSRVAVSVAGGVAHNIGQITAAVFIMGSTAIIYYLPVLILSGVITGVVIGIVSGIVIECIKKGGQTP